MAVIEQDVVLTTKDKNGNTVIQMPITRAENIENVMSIEQGGTGSETAQGARTNLGLASAVTGASIDGKVITLTFVDGTTKTLTTQDTVYSLPTASESTLGGVKVGDGLEISSGVLSVGTVSQAAAAYKIPYATSSTAYNTGAKVATITNGVSFSLVAGARVVVKFTGSTAYSNTSTSNDVTWSTLNVNSTGAKTIKYFLHNSTSSHDTYVVQTNGTYEFVYDGTYWNMMTPYYKNRPDSDS